MHCETQRGIADEIGLKIHNLSRSHALRGNAYSLDIIDSAI